MKSIRAIIKKDVGNVRTGCAYIYPDGVDYCSDETYKGKTVRIDYRTDYPISFRDYRDSGKIARIVVHNPGILLMGKLESVTYYAEHYCKDFYSENPGVQARSVTLQFENGARLNFVEYAFNRGFFNNPDVCIQFESDGPFTRCQGTDETIVSA